MEPTALLAWNWILKRDSWAEISSSQSWRAFQLKLKLHASLYFAWNDSMPATFNHGSWCSNEHLPDTLLWHAEVPILNSSHCLFNHLIKYSSPISSLHSKFRCIDKTTKAYLYYFYSLEKSYQITLPSWKQFFPCLESWTSWVALWVQAYRMICGYDFEMSLAKIIS